MRISAGIYRGKKLFNFTDSELRPTTSMIREAIFNILAHNPYFTQIYNNRANLTFLEICCGSGIVSFEALSRGIKKAVLLDYNPKAKLCFEKNQKNILKNNEITKFILADIHDFANYAIKSDICFFDPPYSKVNYHKIILESLIKNDCLNKNAIIIIESDKKFDFETQNKYFKLLLDKKYGNSKLTFLQLK